MLQFDKESLIHNSINCRKDLAIKVDIEIVQLEFKLKKKTRQI